MYWVFMGVGRGTMLSSLSWENHSPIHPRSPFSVTISKSSVGDVIVASLCVREPSTTPTQEIATLTPCTFRICNLNTLTQGLGYSIEWSDKIARLEGGGTTSTQDYSLGIAANNRNLLEALLLGQDSVRRSAFGSNKPYFGL